MTWFFSRLFKSKYSGLSQKEKVLMLLIENEEVPVYMLIKHGLSCSYHQRIGDLRKEGYDIPAPRVEYKKNSEGRLVKCSFFKLARASTMSV